MKTRLLLLAAMLALVGQAQAAYQLDETAGTNIVNGVTQSMTTAGGWVIPIVAAILFIGGGIGIYRALMRKGRVGT